MAAAGQVELMSLRIAWKNAVRGKLVTALNESNAIFGVDSLGAKKASEALFLERTYFGALSRQDDILRRPVMHFFAMLAGHPCIAETGGGKLAFNDR